MTRRLLAASGLVAGALAIPTGSAHAACVGPAGAGGIAVEVCTEGVIPVPGGYSSASRVAVTINGQTTRYCIARTSVTTSGVYHDPRTLYPC